MTLMNAHLFESPPDDFVREGGERTLSEKAYRRLREALLKLTAEGMVRSEGQRGFEVSPLSLNELQDIMRARTCLDSAVLAQSMAIGDADWEARIIAANHRLARTVLPADTADVATASEWEERHRDFHQALIEGGGSQWLVRLHRQLVDQSERYRQIRLLHRREVKARVRDVVAEHAEITAAVLARDTERAVRLLTTHLQDTADAMGRLLASRAVHTR